MAETRNFGTRNKKDLKALPGRATFEESKSNSIKNLKDELKESTESIKQTRLADLERDARVARYPRKERENERRKRSDELRVRNNDKRNRVEERKRLIFEAEKEKQEAILRKNREKEARIEARRNKKVEVKNRRKSEKRNVPVAFGSSTPRLLCLRDTNDSCGSGFSAMAKEHDKSKKQASIIVGGRNEKFNESCRTDGRSEKPSSFNSQTIKKRSERVRKIQTPPNGAATSQSINVSSIEIFARFPRNSDEYGTSTSRSNSSMSQRSNSTDSLDSCDVKVRPRTTVTRRPIADNSISKLTPIKPIRPRVRDTPTVAAVSTPSEVKKRSTTDTSLLKNQEGERSSMEETMRLANEMLEIEKQRLKIAIEKTKRWEEEEQRKREEKEKERRRQEMVEALKEAIGEAEKQRIVYFERLERSEAERLARRKRVELIMLRTRG